jgi:hypothetical protein
VFPVAQDAECDCESELDEDEGQFYPERDTQVAVLPVVDAEALVFGADEDCGDDVTATRNLLTPPSVQVTNKVVALLSCREGGINIHKDNKACIVRRVVLNVIQARQDN